MIEDSEGGNVSPHKAIVERYFEGFRRRDHERILACLTDDVVWDLPGHAHLAGKEAFDREIERPDATDGPTLIIDRLVEEADTVVAIGSGEGSQPREAAPSSRAGSRPRPPPTS